MKKGSIVTYLNQRRCFGVIVDVVENKDDSPIAVKVLWLHKKPSTELVFHLRKIF